MACLFYKGQKLRQIVNVGEPYIQMDQNGLDCFLGCLLSIEAQVLQINFWDSRYASGFRQVASRSI